MKILAISDLHGYLPSVEPCDLLLIAGDLCPSLDHRPDAQAEWLNTDFADWLARIPAKQVVGIAGNHDFVFDRSPHLVSDRLRWTYLQDSEVTAGQLRIYGSPWCPQAVGWAFSLGESELATKWQAIPSGIDLLITHTPPLGYGDLAADGRRVGSPSLFDRVCALSPKAMLVGHVHASRGRHLLPNRAGFMTRVMNVSHLDGRDEPCHPPLEVNFAGE